MPLASIQAVSLDDKRALERFIRFPFGLYQADPNWVPPLLIERRQMFAADNPYFEHAEIQLWLAIAKNGLPVGRISAQIDALGPREVGQKVGSFGLFECINDRNVAQQLLSTAQNWLSARGCTRMTGPFSLSINQESGLLVDGYDTPPYIMMGHAPRYYRGLVEHAGFQKAKNLHAWLVNLDFSHPAAFTALESKYGARIKIRAINKSALDRDLGIVLNIFNDAWSENWGFIPFTVNEFSKMSKEILHIVPANLFRIAELDGEPAGMIVMLPNLNELIADLNGRLIPVGIFKFLWRLLSHSARTSRVPLMGISKKYQNSLTGSALAFQLIASLQEEGLKQGFRNVEMSWVLEDNFRLSKILKAIGGHSYKTYRVYQKTIKPQRSGA